MIIFTGSRSPSSVLVAQACTVAARVSVMGLPVGVGCAHGIDQVVRGAIQSAQVFRSAGPAAWQLAERSITLVRACKSSFGWRVVVGFPSGACPVGLAPSQVSSHCFAGYGSGTWATLAFAAGVRLPVVVFAPAGALPAWGSWQQVPWGPLAGGYVLRNAQLQLF